MIRATRLEDDMPARAAADREPWIRSLRPAPGHAVKLLCFPHAGGSASYYVPLARSLPKSVEVYGVQYPGRQDRFADPMIDDLFVLAERIHEVLTPPLDGPVAFFGHSMGATVAFEVIRLMEGKGQTPPVRLFASARRAPSRSRDDGVHRLDDEGLVAEVSALNPSAAHAFADADFLSIVLPALRNDYRAVERYRCTEGATVSCPITTFLGTEDPKVTEPEVRAWAEHTTAGLDLERFSGGHFYVEDHWPRLAAELTRRLT
ncbi:alpha/beta fold hydrolase [Nonomuraea sp. NPDC049419]|uniref:thioesterase II family protein n=1 Tax=Nonomuraea sp. NPDC049419 TaxID=3155772 RepID=UPI00342413AF